MKITFTIVAVLLLASSVTALAAPDTTRVDKNVARLQKQLDLTADQAEQIREILLNPRAGGPAPTENRPEKGKRREKKDGAWKQDIDSQIEAVLNDQQRAEYEKIKNAPPPPRRGDRSGMLLKRLQLNETQSAQVREILDAAQKKRQELRATMTDGSVDRESMRQAMQGIAEETESRLTEILTDEQMAEYKKYREENRRQEPNERRGRGRRQKDLGDDG